MRSAYCRAQARWLRWKEEIELLLEEMSRVTLFLLWKAKWWESRASMRTDINPALVSGCVAYACRQQWIFESLAKKFHAKWVPFLAKHSLSVIWSPELPIEVEPSAETTTNVTGATPSIAATDPPPASTLLPSSAPDAIGEPRIVEMNTVLEASDEIEGDAEEDDEVEAGGEGEGGKDSNDMDFKDSDEEGYDSPY